MSLAGADEIYLMGGAQAIGALAYGTETIKSVDFIALVFAATRTLQGIRSRRMYACDVGSLGMTQSTMWVRVTRRCLAGRALELLGDWVWRGGREPSSCPA